ncbi:MAG: conjugal transfer protein TraF [Ahniella sp.]|nr:conjugal transfer protein TraF [Ahniella sp.]
MRHLLWTLLVLLPGLSHSQGLPKPSPTHERGWFYYQPLPPLVPSAKPDPTRASPNEPDSMVPLGSAWLRKNLPIYLDRAVDQPTLANVRRYRYLERLAMDRSSAYSDTSARLTMLDPLLDEQQVSPLTALAKATRHREIDRDRQRLLEGISEQAGLWFFFRSDCPYCHAQVPALLSLARVHEFSILPISIDRKPMPGEGLPRFVPDNGQAAKLGVQVTPTLFLVHRDGRVLPLATGLQTMDQIEFRMIELGHTMGWISDAEFAAIQPLQNTLLDDVAADLDNGADPDQLIDQMIRQGAGRLGVGSPIQLPEAEMP